MNNTILASIISGSIGFLLGLIILFFRVRAVKNILQIANKKLINDKDSKLADLKMQVELLKEQKKRTEIDTQRLMTEQMTAVFDNIGDSKSNQELLKALKEFHKFTLDLDRKLPSGHFFEDDSEYYFHVALEVNNSIDKILSFCNKFLEDYSHLYISDSLPKKLTELIYKLKNIEHDQQTIVSISGQSFDDAFDETASEMIDVWSELFDILQEMRDRNDDFLKIKTIFLNKIKIAK